MGLERGLGRGLGALLGDAALQSQEGGSVKLPISQIEPGAKQPRKRFDEVTLADLAASISEHGVIQPLTVRRLASGYYQIIAGERRWRAAKLAGMHELPVTIIEADDRKVMELGLVENLQREDLNPIDEANGYRTLLDEHGLTQEEIATRVGKSRPAVANALRLLALPDAVRYLLEEGRISAGHARAVLSLPNASLQKRLAQEIVDGGLSVRDAERRAKKLAGEEKEAAAKTAPESNIYIADLEKRLSSSYGRKVRIVEGKNKGRIELEYYSSDDLETLLALLSGGEEG